ncbi:hypothetical protein SDC9_148422 [bioreactor metagenome]|uniref:Uncharacterized protein n=1 Tax=bioreactor metagenome TaxID=1076179 RepID=A0A645EID8_9ZZZZ
MREIDAGFTGVHVRNAKHFFCFGNTNLRRSSCFQFFVNRIVFSLDHLSNNTCQYFVQVCRFFARARNNQWCPRLVNKNAIHLIDNCVIKRSLYHLVKCNDHVVTQIIKAKFIISAVCYIRGISSFSFGEIKSMNDQAYRKA